MASTKKSETLRWSSAEAEQDEEYQGGVCSTWLMSALAPGEGERQAGGEETSLLVPSSPDSSVTGERSVWQRPAVIWPHAPKQTHHTSVQKEKKEGKQPDQRSEETQREIKREEKKESTQTLTREASWQKATLLLISNQIKQCADYAAVLLPVKRSSRANTESNRSDRSGWRNSPEYCSHVTLTLEQPQLIRNLIFITVFCTWQFFIWCRGPFRKQSHVV